MKIRNRRMIVVGMVDSPHLIHWLNEIAGLEIFSSIYVFPSTSPKPAGEIKVSQTATRIRILGILKHSRFTSLFFTFFDKSFGQKWRSNLLSLCLKIIRPSVLHLHELQHGGYLLEQVPVNEKRTKILCSTWGSDLVLYGKLESQKERLRTLLNRTDFLLTERSDDLNIAQGLGFKGVEISPSYATIGSEISEIPEKAPSARTKIVIKGYQDNHGRGLNVLQAMTLIPEVLSPYEITIISASESVQVMSEYMRDVLKYKIDCAPKLSRDEVLQLFRESRLYIGLGISDGISNTMIESMQVGTFPIQSMNSCAPEFIKDGVSGFVVDPWDINRISTLIERALNEDSLVDNAAALNLETVRVKYSRVEGLRVLNGLYRGILDG